MWAGQLQSSSNPTCISESDKPPYVSSFHLQHVLGICGKIPPSLPPADLQQILGVWWAGVEVLRGAGAMLRGGPQGDGVPPLLPPLPRLGLVLLHDHVVEEVPKYMVQVQVQLGIWFRVRFSVGNLVACPSA